MPAAVRSTSTGSNLLIAAVIVIVIVETRGRAAEHGSHGRRVRRERGGVGGQPLSVAARRAAGAFARNVQLDNVGGTIIWTAEFKAQTERGRSVGTR